MFAFLLFSGIVGVLMAATTLSWVKSVVWRERELELEDEGIRVSGLFLHPLKSGKAVSVEEAEVDNGGLVWDRRWMVVKAASFRMVTQRQLPRMALITSAVRRDDPSQTPSLVLSAPGMQDLEVPVQENGRHGTAILWGEGHPCTDQGDVAAEWLTTFLSADGGVRRGGDSDSDSGDDDDDNDTFRLVFQTDKDRRPITSPWTGWTAPSSSSALAPVNRVSFADGFPFLLASETSLEDLNARLSGSGKDTFPMSRFRPNIVVSGAAMPWDEDNWRTVVIGEEEHHAVFHGPKLCERCKMTTTDQDTGLQGGVQAEPLVTLRTFRKRDGKVLFGANLTHTRASIGTILRVGDVVYVANKGPVGW